MNGADQRRRKKRRADGVAQQTDAYDPQRATLAIFDGQREKQRNGRHRHHQRGERAGEGGDADEQRGRGRITAASGLDGAYQKQNDEGQAGERGEVRRLSQMLSRKRRRESQMPVQRKATSGARICEGAVSE